MGHPLHPMATKFLLILETLEKTPRQSLLGRENQRSNHLDLRMLVCMPPALLDWPLTACTTTTRTITLRLCQAHSLVTSTVDLAPHRVHLYLEAWAWSTNRSRRIL
jgi:hypothetical protein